MGYGLVGVSVGFLAGALICLCYSMIVLRGRLEGVFSYGKLLSYSLPLYVNGLIGLGFGWADLLVLQLMVGSLPLTGVYYLVTAGAGVLSILWSPIASALFPAMSARGSVNPGGLKEEFEGSLRVINTLVTPISVAVACVSPTALTVAYGEGYAQGALAFSLVAVVAAFSAYSSIFVTVLQSVGKTLHAAYIGGLSAFLGTGLALALAKQFSLVGVALSRVATTLTMFLLGYLFVKKAVEFKLDEYSVKRSLIVTLCSAPVLLVVDALMRSRCLNVACVALLDAALFVALGVANMIFWKPLILRDVEMMEKALPLGFSKVSSLLRSCAKQVET